MGNGVRNRFRLPNRSSTVGLSRFASLLRQFGAGQSIETYAGFRGIDRQATRAKNERFAERFPPVALLERSVNSAVSDV